MIEPRSIVDWQKLHPDELEMHFLPRNSVADAEERLAGWAQRSISLSNTLQPSREVRYGNGPRMTFDLFDGAGPNAPTVLFIHGGYWRALDKETHLFVVDGLLRGGVNVINLGYDLCPTVTLTELNEQIAIGVRCILEQWPQLGLGIRRLFLMGHSAGAHAVAMAAFDRAVAAGISGVIPVSGIFDTRAVKLTSVNEQVQLSDDEADQLNALKMAPGADIPILCLVGGAEPPAWIGQSVAYHRMALNRVSDCRLEVVDGADHFSVLEASVDADHPAGMQVLEFIGQQ